MKSSISEGLQCSTDRLTEYNVRLQLLFSVLQFFVILLLLVLTEVTLVLVIHIFHDKVSLPHAPNKTNNEGNKIKKGIQNS